MNEELPEDLREVFLGFKAKTHDDAPDERYCDDHMTPTKIMSSLPTATRMAKEKVINAKKIGETMFAVTVPDGPVDLTNLDNLESEMVESDILALKTWFEKHPPLRKWKAHADTSNGFIRIHDTADPADRDRYLFVCDNLTVGLKRIKKAL